MNEYEEAVKFENEMVQKVLDSDFYAFDIDEALTVREYLSRLLLTLLEKGECFSGKRPFGNSGWENFLLVPCVRAGAIQGEIDMYDPNYPQAVGYDAKEFRKFRSALIFGAMKRAPKSPTSPAKQEA